MVLEPEVEPLSLLLLAAIVAVGAGKVSEVVVLETLFEFGVASVVD